MLGGNNLDRNGYFVFSVKDGATYCTVFPPTGNGKNVTIENIVAYLNIKKFSTFDVKEVQRELNRVGANGTFKVSDVGLKSYTAFCDYKITPDGMYVMATMYPPMMSDQMIMPKEILGDLEVKGIRFGVNGQAIVNMVGEKLFNTPIVIAQGIPPVQGKDAKIEYLFNSDIDAKPTIKEDGTVDYHDLDLISRVAAGQTVARMIPEDYGKPGKDVFGKEVQPYRVKKVNFKYGNNLAISEDGMSLISKVSGQVTLEGEKVFVSDTYEVPVDVDLSTGNINFDGNVIVRGTVRSGFIVKATKDVTIYGVVEGAEVYAGGNIMINRGVQGMNKAIIQAGGDIISKFIESATATAGQDVESDSLLHSNVSAGRDIKVSGRNGLIVGGSVKATSSIEAKQVGNDMGTNTEISVGVDPNVRKRIKELGDRIKKMSDEKEKLNQVVTVLRKRKDIEGTLDEGKTEMLQKSMRNIILMEQQIKQDNAEFKECQMKNSENDKACVRVLGDIYPGCKVVFGATSSFIKDKKTYCKFVKRGADVVTDII